MLQLMLYFWLNYLLKGEKDEGESMVLDEFDSKEKAVEWLESEIKGKVLKVRALQQGLEFNEDHNSERLGFSIPEVYCIENNGALEELREKIENFIGAKVY